MLKPLLVGLAAFGLSTLAVAAPVAGQDYTVLDTPVKTQVEEGQIEVTGVFWYGCPHCYNLEKPLEPWVAELPEDVTFNRLPATMGDTWVKHAFAYYAAEDLGIVDEVHNDFFDALHEQGKRLTDPNDIADFFSNYDVSEEDALAALNSFGVKSQVNKANARMRSMELMGVPALVVDGRYVISPSSAGSLDNMPLIAGSLIEQIRNERGTSASAASQAEATEESSQE
ncbi:thiol:disulfide interchange protein DsbA/DsbL [Halomonas halocynthiae]|uniref:thiol:disulfide interchange protein DsbA/DsbL n=1 Tax=Halomonas halocynthiae TaxID=176290 RepID=UPI0004222008|nr:thiol:disulfide interchange protein DsbA/DsbL [Halomonas halocynthiae]